MKTLIFIPTYNEAQNIQLLVSKIRKLKLRVDILIIDDGSPDGTGVIADSLTHSNSPERIFVKHRHGKLGIGSAHKVGIQWAYDNNYDVLVTMDADFSHDPAHIPIFLKNAPQGAVIVGSRYLQKGSIDDWNFIRKLLTRLGHLLTYIFLGMKYDASGAYRLYNLNQIPQEIFSKVKSNSYSFFFESLFILYINHVSIYEIPIKLPKRTYGSSKMNLSAMYISIHFLYTLFLRKIFAYNSLILK